MTGQSRCVRLHNETCRILEERTGQPVLAAF